MAEQSLTPENLESYSTEAISNFSKAIEDFADVLITDVGLPDGDALDILPKLQKNNPDLKIIVMSARTTLLTAVRAEKKGAQWHRVPDLKGYRERICT